VSELVPTEFWQGVEQFNRQEYYDCHDTLEAIWMEAMEPQKTFYQGILQMAVALYHLGNANWQGAVTLLGESIYRLNRYTPEYAGVNVAQLLEQAQALLIRLQEGGKEQVEAIASQLQASSSEIGCPHIARHLSE
jgi:predicted metal-dependent hydrolase